jgi:hypothetical protein
LVGAVVADFTSRGEEVLLTGGSGVMAMRSSGGLPVAFDGLFGGLLDKTIVWGFGPDACEDDEMEEDALTVVAVIGAVGVGLDVGVDIESGSGEDGCEFGAACAGCGAVAALGLANSL